MRSGSGSRRARIQTSCAVVSAPTFDRAFARWCLTVECAEPEPVGRSLLRPGSYHSGNDADLADWSRALRRRRRPDLSGAPGQPFVERSLARRVEVGSKGRHAADGGSGRRRTDQSERAATTSGLPRSKISESAPLVSTNNDHLVFRQTRGPRVVTEVRTHVPHALPRTLPRGIFEQPEPVIDWQLRRGVVVERRTSR